MSLRTPLQNDGRRLYAGMAGQHRKAAAVLDGSASTGTFISRTHMIKKCLFPAAGYGTRFLPATKAMPKEMLPVVNKPLIQYGVEEALAAGLNQIAIVTGRGKRSLEDNFDISSELGQQMRNTEKEKTQAGKS